MKQIVTLLLITMLCACATPTSQSSEIKVLKPEASKWAGRTADDLVVAIGAPTNVYNLDSGYRLFEYIQKRRSVKVKTQITNEQREAIERSSNDKIFQKLLSQYSHRKVVSSCAIVYQVNADNIVENESLEGSGC